MPAGGLSPLTVEGHGGNRTQWCFRYHGALGETRGFGLVSADGKKLVFSCMGQFLFFTEITGAFFSVSNTGFARDFKTATPMYPSARCRVAHLCPDQPSFVVMPAAGAATRLVAAG